MLFRSIEPDRLDLQGERSAGQETFNLLPAAAGGREDRRGGRLSWALGLVACALLAVLAYLPIQQKDRDPVVAELLAEITRLLPDDTWIIQMGWHGDRLTLAGYSGSSSALIALLEESDLLSNVRFNSPVTVDRRLELERFNLSAKVNEKEAS